jgi:hypothetical protein
MLRILLLTTLAVTLSGCVGGQTIKDDLIDNGSAWMWEGDECVTVEGPLLGEVECIPLTVFEN